MSTRPTDLAASLTGRPSTATSSVLVARSPSLATRPPAVTRPASIQDSISRREPRPAAASSFCSRSAFGAGGGLGFCGGFGICRPDAGLCGRDGLKLEGLGNFFKWRQLFQRTQAEVVEEPARRGVEGGPARRLAVADDIDPAARFERLDDLGRDHYAADVLDIAARHRLAVGNDRERFHDGAGIARGLLRREAFDIGAKVAGGLESPAARHVDELDGPALPFS